MGVNQGVSPGGGKRTRLLAIVGPTAAGKTEVSVEVALRVGGEIVSADSMQVYRGMDIGTAKPTPQERRGVPHHLIDLFAPDHPFSVAEFQSLARRAIEDIAGRGRLPMLVGGTGLYVQAVTEDFRFRPPEGDAELRRNLVALAEVEGPEALHGRLQQVDPAAAERIHPHDRRRVVRALEVYLLTGHPIGAERGSAGPYDLLPVGLGMGRSALYRRIDARVEAMIHAGWLREVRELLEAGYGPELYAMQALGYRELVSHLRGELVLGEAVALIQRNTRRFAKRQLTWFRRDSRIRWIPVGEDRDIQDVVADIVRLVEGKWGRV